MLSRSLLLSETDNKVPLPDLKCGPIGVRQRTLISITRGSALGASRGALLPSTFIDSISHELLELDTVPRTAHQ
jgi:hypothetical protein